LDAAFFEWCLRAKPERVLYISSSASYPTLLQRGKPHRLQEHEGLLGGADQTYGWTKKCGEHLAEQVRKAGIGVTVVRPFSGYGEDQDSTYPFPAIIARAKSKQSPFQVWGDGHQVRDFIHVDDVVRLSLELMEMEVDGPVNLGTGVPTSMRQLAELAMAHVGYEAQIEPHPEMPEGVQYRVADITKLTEWGCAPRISLEEGIRRALA